MAEALAELDYGDKAKDELLRVASLVPDRSLLPLTDGLYLEAINSVVARDFPNAIKAYTEIARRLSNDPKVYVDLGRAFEKNNEPDKAIENYLRATALDSQYATAYLRAGILYSRKRDAAKATAALDQAERRQSRVHEQALLRRPDRADVEQMALCDQHRRPVERDEQGSGAADVQLERIQIHGQRGNGADGSVDARCG